MFIFALQPPSFSITYSSMPFPLLWTLLTRSDVPETPNELLKMLAKLCSPGRARASMQCWKWMPMNRTWITWSSSSSFITVFPATEV